MRSYLYKIFFFFLLLSGSFAEAQVKFYASISPEKINKNDVFQLRLAVENAIEVQQILPPQLNDFIMVSGPNQESGMTVTNGDVKKYIAISYILKPKAAGNFIIPSAMAIADGKKLQSNVVALSVVNSVSPNNVAGNGFNSPFSGLDPFEEVRPENSFRDYILKKGENAEEKIKKNILVRADSDKKTCFVGEPVVATYKLYTRLKSESNLTKNPSFNGFSVIDLQKPDNVNYNIENFNGKEYNVYTIRKAQLYPLQPGNLLLEPAEIENVVRFVKEDYSGGRGELIDDLFRDFNDASIPANGMEDHRITLQSAPLAILVKPLPDANKPLDFKGAVGNFSVESTVEKNSFTTDDAGRLTLIISGAGNLQLVTTPEIIWPMGIDGFEPQTTDDLFKTTVPVSGRKIIKYLFTVDKPGTYSIPAIPFSFFDPKEAKYKTVVTKTLSFTVTKGTGKPRNEIATENTIQKESLLNRLFSNRLSVVSMVAFIIICGLIFWLKNDNKKIKLQNERAQAQKRVAEINEPAEEWLVNQQNPLAPAEEMLIANNGMEFYKVLNQSLKNYLSNKLQIAPEELNKKTISERLDSKGITNTTTLQLNSLMDEIEWKLFTPFAENEKMQETYQMANELIQLINTYKT